MPFSSQAFLTDIHDAGFDPVFGPLELDTFNTPFSEDESGLFGCHGNLNDDFLVAQMHTQHHFDNPSFMSTPSSDSDLGTPPLMIQAHAQLDFSSLTGNQSFMGFASPLSSVDSLSSHSDSSASSPMHFDQDDILTDGLTANSLGLFDHKGLLNGLDGVLQDYTSSFLGLEVSQSIATDLPVAPAQQLLPVPDDSLLSPIVVATAQLSIETAPNEHIAPQAVSPVATCGVISEPNALGNPSTLDTSVLAAESSQLPPPPTPRKSMKRTSPSSARKVGARRVRPTRAAAAKHKSYRELSASPAPGSPVHLAFASMPNHSSDECEYGSREWFSDERGRQVEKWKCHKCYQLVGRRPDLHRHYKKCVKKEKYHCVDVTHSDGTVWRGCGMVFSRRDACHRHLKKRFTDGRCIKKKPREDHPLRIDEYLMKMELYEDGIDNCEWRAALSAEEKNRLVRTALSQIKKDMF